MGGVLTGSSVLRPQLPAGAAGIWYMDQQTTLANVISLVPNSATGVAAPLGNMLPPSRRMFTGFASVPWVPSGIDSITEGTSGPDALNEATSIGLLNTTADWRLFQGFNVSAGPTTGNYTIAVWAKAIAGTCKFKLGLPFSSWGSSEFTATGSWVRYSFTFAWTAGAVAPDFGIGSDINAATCTLAICDLNMYAGSSDLGADPTLGHIYTSMASANPAVLTSGLINCEPNIGLFQWGSSATYGAGQPHTSICCFKRSGADPSNDFVQCWWTKADDDGFAAGTNALGGPGLNFGAGGSGTYVGESQCVVRTSNAHAGSLFNYVTGGLIIGATVWDGTNLTTWLNGVKILGPTATEVPANYAYQDMFFNALAHNDHVAGNTYSSLVWYNRALSDVEVLQATNALRLRARQTSNELTSVKWAFVIGDQVSFGEFPFRAAETVTNKIHGANYSYTDALISGATIDAVITRVATTMRTAILATQAAGGQVTTCLVYLGRKNLGTGTGAVTAASVLAIHDTLRAAGIKTIACTLIDALYGANQTQFNNDRVAFNSAIVAGSAHYDALCNLALVTNMGANGDHSNGTYFGGDGISPTATGHALLEPRTTTAFDSL